MLAFTGSRISPHLIKKECGTLVCMSVPIAREGTQPYRLSELGIGSSDELITVHRPSAEVFDKVAVASFEGCPVCDEHPSTFLRPENWSGYARGHAQNIRPGPKSPDGRLLLADLVISDGDLIAKIEHGKRGVSCGYSCEYTENSDGTFTQRRVRGNHIAITREARAGKTVRINDGAPVYDVSDFAEVARRYHRKNALEVPQTLAVRWPLHSITTDTKEGEQDMKDQDWGKVNTRLDQVIDLLDKFIAQQTTKGGTRRTLTDEINSIKRSARATEELTASGAGPARFHEQLRRLNQAYDMYAMDTEAGQEYSDACAAAGAKMRGDTESYEQILKRCRTSGR